MAVEVFISFKNSDQAQVTEDAGIASSIFTMLMQKKIPTFYSNKSLLDLGDTRFKESIVEALSDASILILVASKIDYIRSKWVEFEWNSFHTLSLDEKGKKRIIIPYLSGDIDPHELPLPLRPYEIFNIDTFSVESLVSFVEEMLNGKRSVSEKLANYESYTTSFATRCESIYSSSYGNEFERLRIQAENTLPVDSRHLDYIYNNMPQEDLVVLDVGSSYGFVANSRFGADPRIKTVICIDQDPVVVKKGREIIQNEKLKFYCCSASHGDPEDLKAILRENNTDLVDIIFVSMVAHHWQNPERVFRKLRSFLKPTGYCYIRTCDDGAILAYPDSMDIVGQVIRRSSRVVGSSDRYHARKISDQLVNSGFSNIRLFADARSTLGMDMSARMHFFTEKFGFRLDYLKKNFENNPSDPVAFADYQWMADAIDCIEDLFYKPNFWYCESEFICIAQKC